MKKATAFLLFFGIILLTGCLHLFEDNLNASQKAYLVQNQLVKQQNKKIIGYKAGLTSKAGQAKFGVTEPVAGVLFRDGLSFNTQTYVLADDQKLMLETEVGYVLKKDMPLFPTFPPDPNFAIGMIDKVVPVIELPDLTYPDMSKVTGLTLIETNVASNQILIGKGLTFNDINLNSITTKLMKNGEIVIEGKATDAMGDQVKALHWLMETLYANGYQLKKGDILITGALGKMIPAERGQYNANFGQLGKLSFSIQ